MVTINELTFDLLGVLRAGGANITDDEGVTLRQIAFWVKNTRSLLIRQQLSKRQSISDNITQTIKCLDMSPTDASTCCDVSSNCFMIKSNLRIPTPIESNQKDLIERVMPQIVGARSYPFIPYARAAYWGNSPFNKNQPASFLYNGYLYIMNSDFIDKVTIQGVFEDPEELANFSNCEGDPCYTQDDRYPISNHMIETMKKMIVDSNFRIILQASVDTHNNASGGLSPNIANE